MKLENVVHEVEELNVTVDDVSHNFLYIHCCALDVKLRVIELTHASMIITPLKIRFHFSYYKIDKNQLSVNFDNFYCNL